MEGWQQRVVDEQKALQIKLDKLADFLNTTTFSRLPPDDQEYLSVQESGMRIYNEALKLRIRRFQ